MNGSMSLSKSWVFRLLVINIVIFLLQILMGGQMVVQTAVMDNQIIPFSQPVMIHFLGLTPAMVLEKAYLWQVVSYMFLHGSLLHLVLNMYALFLFGIAIEQAWGSRRFLFYYFFTGIGAGLSILLINSLMGGASYYGPTIGASGAVFGILLAFGMLFPDVELIMFFFLPVPIKAKYMVMLYGGIEVLSLVFTRGQGNISHIGHIGGLVFGLLYFLILRKKGLQFRAKIIRARMRKSMDQKVTIRTENKEQAKHDLVKILDKVKSGGSSLLSDDEYQYVRYLEIMTGDKDDLCRENDFVQEDQYCRKCASYEACMIREIKKYW